MNAIERLEKLLDEKDNEIETLSDKIQELEDHSEYDWAWARHFKIETDEIGLPIPRLELRCEKLDDGWYNFEWLYGIVYRHFLGHGMFIPLGLTKVGGLGKPPIYEDGTIMTPFREGAHFRHDAKHFGMPIYAIIEGKTYDLSKQERHETFWLPPVAYSR